MRTGSCSVGWLACGCFCLLTAQAFAQPSEKYLSDDIQSFPVPSEVRRSSNDLPGSQRIGLPGRRTLTEAASARTPAHRLDHLRKAAENLELAGFEREAVELRERAAQLERELRSQSSPDPLHEEIRQLRQSVDLLREEVHFLRRQLQMQLPFKGIPDLSQEGDSVRPHEARIRLPDRKEPVPDAELDKPEYRELKEPANETQRSRRRQNPDVEKDVEFELVPVPYPENPEKSEPVPTPASRHAPPKK